MNNPNGDGDSVFEPQREGWGGLTRIQMST